MPITVLGGTKLADTAYEVANSCVFDAASGAYMSKSLGTPTSAKKATYSVWIKRCSLGTHSNSTDTNSGQGIVTFKPSNGNFERWNFNGGNKLDFYSEASSTQEYWLHDGPGEYVDVSAWYHVVIALDSTQSTAANRFKVYLNGTQLTNPTQTSYIDQNSDHVGLASGSTVYVGLGKSHNTNVFYADFHMAEVCFIDGTQYAASDFGEFDSDSPTVWKPKDPSGLTFGNNGFYLDFEDSSNLGNDANGGTDLTETNIAATDQRTDTPTLNYPTLNPLVLGSYATLSEGNLHLNGNTASDSGATIATIGFPENGKWYIEEKMTDQTGQFPESGVFNDIENDNFQSNLNAAGGIPSNAAGVSINCSGNIMVDGSSAHSISSISDGQIKQYAIDMDNGALYIGLNNTWYNSGDPTSGATRTGAIDTWTAGTRENMMFGATAYNGSDGEVNFGSPSYANSSDAADANGYGAFEYSPPSGYYALNSKNIAEFG